MKRKTKSWKLVDWFQDQIINYEFKIEFEICTLLNDNMPIVGIVNCNLQKSKEIFSLSMILKLLSRPLCLKAQIFIPTFFVLQTLVVATEF